MFFGKTKELENEVLSLKSEIDSLKNELNKQNQKFDNDKNALVAANKSQLSVLEQEIELLKDIASISQEEGLIVFDSKDKLYFINSRAKENITDPSVVIEASIS